MKKNRKKQAQGVLFPAPLAAVLVLLAAVFIGYLWLCSSCEGLGAHIKALEKTRAEVHKRVLNEEFKWSNMKSPQNIELLMRKHNLVMTFPDDGNVVRLRAGIGAPATGRQEYAGTIKVATHD